MNGLKRLLVPLLLVIGCGDSSAEPADGGGPSDGGSPPGDGGAGASPSDGGSGGVGAGEPGCSVATEDADCGADTICALNTCSNSVCEVVWAAAGIDCDGAQGELVCDGFSGCVPMGPAHQWSFRAGDAGSAVARLSFGEAVATDSQGNVIVTAAFAGSVDFGDGTLLSQGESEVFVIKLDPSGKLLWSKQFGSAGFEESYKVLVDADDNLVLIGLFTETIDFGGEVLENDTFWDLWAAKLDPDGNHLWSRSFPGFAHMGGSTLDSEGNLIIAGFYNGDVDFGGGPLTSSLDDWGGFLAKLDTNGDHVWSKAFDGPADQYLKGVGIDPEGNLLIAGDFTQAIDLGGGALASAGSNDLFVAKLDAEGNHLSSNRFGGAGEELIWGMRSDASGRLVLWGSYTDSLDLGGTPVTDTNSNRFLAALDGEGNHVWSRSFDGYILSIAAGTSDDVIVVGQFDLPLDFGGGILVNQATDLFALRLDANGDHVWSIRAGDASPQNASAVGTDSAGNVLLFGRFEGSINLGGGPLVSAGSTDVFVAKLGP
jgi:hypothetical protein